MKLSVLALDYDGTIAHHDVPDPGVLAAIADARAASVVVLLVTGRRLHDLQRVAGDLRFVDGVVAENGAVVHFPGSSHTSILAPPVPTRFLEELTRCGIAHATGTCIAEADSVDAPALLAAIRTTELPLCLLFNRGRVMILPQSVSKATGLEAALEILRLSPHGAVGIGDAENDHELLRVCEVGVAAGWGSESLRLAADHVIAGEGPAALAPFIRGLVDSGRLPPVRTTRRQLVLGHGDDGRQFSLAVRGRNVLVAGDAGSGKSWVAGLLAEQLILHRYSVCVIDPEGDYRPLQALPGVIALGGADPLPRPHELLRALQHPDTSVVLDLSRLSHADKVQFVHSVLPALVLLRRRTGLPDRIVLDEAHYFVHTPRPADLFDAERYGYTLVTYRASHLPREILDASEVVLVTSESDPAEVAALHALCGATEPVERWATILAALGTGEAAALPVTEEAGSTLRRIHLAPRLTAHVRHREKYVDVPITDDRAFVFTSHGAPTGDRALTLRAFANTLDRLPTDVACGHARRGDFGRWIRDVFGDYLLASTVQDLEQRCWQGGDPDAIAAIGSAIRGRYELGELHAATAPSGAR